MRLKILLAVFASGLPLASCAIHPLPEDVTGRNEYDAVLDTHQIVRQIRCETALAGYDLIMDDLSYIAQNDIRAKDTADRLLSHYAADPYDMANFNPDSVLPGSDFKAVRDYLNVILSIGVGYNFDLTMEETNNVSANLDLVGTWMPKFTSGIGGDFNRDRANDRTFTITDTLGKLLRARAATMQGPGNTTIHYCDQQIVTPNYVYPIAGQVGVYKTIRQFVAVAAFDNLAVASAGSAGSTGNAASGGKKAGSKAATPSTGSGATANSGAWVEALTFKTTLDASATPKITFGPASGLAVSDFSIGPTASRIDTHKLTLSVSLPDSGQNYIQCLHNDLLPSLAAANCTVVKQKQSSPFVGKTIVARPRTSAEERAVQAIDNYKSLHLTLTPSP